MKGQALSCNFPPGCLHFRCQLWPYLPLKFTYLMPIPFPNAQSIQLSWSWAFSSSASLAGHLNIIQILPLIFVRQYESQWYFGEEIITIKIQQRGGEDNDGRNKSYLCQLLQASLSRIIWPSGSLECWWDDGTRLGYPCLVLLFDKHVNTACTVAFNKCTYKLDFVFVSALWFYDLFYISIHNGE